MTKILLSIQVLDVEKNVPFHAVDPPALEHAAMHIPPEMNAKLPKKPSTTMSVPGNVATLEKDTTEQRGTGQLLMCRLAHAE